MAAPNTDTFSIDKRGDREIVATRKIAAPPEHVFRALSDPFQVRRWYGPYGTVMKTCDLDFRVGGKWRYVSQFGDHEAAFHGEILEIDAPRRIVQTEIYEPMPEHPTVATMELAPDGAGTRLHLVIRHESEAGRDGQFASGMEWGMRQTYDRLEELAIELADPRPGFRLSRHYNAPRALVFEAWSKKEHIDNWMVPHGFTVVESEADFREGGTWSLTMRSPEGNDWKMGGEYREIVESERIVQTHQWRNEGGSDLVTLITVTFADEDGGTRLNFSQTGFEKSDVRISNSEGWSEVLESLGAYLEGTVEGLRAHG